MALYSKGGMRVRAEQNTDSKAVLFIDTRTNGRCRVEPGQWLIEGPKATWVCDDDQFQARYTPIEEE